MGTVRVARNVWGNYKCWSGRQVVTDYGQEWSAIEWLSDQIEAGNTLSPKSEIDMNAINKWRARLGLPLFL